MNNIFPPSLTLSLGEQTLVYERWQLDATNGLRYGDNPEQPAAMYTLKTGTLTLGEQKFRTTPRLGQLQASQILQVGRSPSKNNLTDLDNGCNILQYLNEKPAAVILKHTNPCGVAWSSQSLADALQKAWQGDQIAAFGGVVVVNRPLDLESAQLISANYFEVVAAPSFSEPALELIKQRKNLRIIQLDILDKLPSLPEYSQPFLDIKSLIDGSLILQPSFQNRVNTIADFLPAQATTPDKLTLTALRPTPKQLNDLLFAWAVEAGVTSNSVIFAKEGRTLAIGTAEQDRVGAVELAIFKAYRNHTHNLAFHNYNLSLFELKKLAKTNPDAAQKLETITNQTLTAKANLPGSVLVSDGFFPFRDAVDLCIEQGVVAIAQPGGSMRDFEVIMAVNEATPPVGMVFTGQRSFKH